MKLLIIIPCLRERDRLPAFLPDLLAAISLFQEGVEVMAVDDASAPAP